MTTTALYCRQSLTREDESASIGDQRGALLALADRRGWQVVGIYEDADAPAEDVDARERWAALLIDADAGNFEIVAAYDTTRLWRSLEMKVVTCKLLAEAGVHTVATLGASVPTDGTDDPEGALIGDLLASVSQFDNAMRAKKVRDAHKRAAREGVAWSGGRRPFGYTRGRREIVDREATLIRSAVERVVRGEAINAIVEDWNRRGVRTATGDGTWTRMTLTRLLRSPSIAGVRVHRGNTYPGVWEPIITAVEHAQVVGVLDSRIRPHGGPGTPRLLSSTGLLRCGVCKARMHARTVHVKGKADGRQYACPPASTTQSPGCGRVAVMARLVEDEVRDRVFAVLDPDLVDRFVRQAANADERVARAHETLSTLAKRRALIGRTLVRTGDADAARAALDELEELETTARADLAASGSAVDVVITAAADPPGWWNADTTDMLDRRRLLEALCRTVEVAPSSAAAFTWDPERVVIDWAV